MSQFDEEEVSLQRTDASMESRELAVWPLFTRLTLGERSAFPLQMNSLYEFAERELTMKQGNTASASFLARHHHSWLLCESISKRTLIKRIHRAAVLGVQRTSPVEPNADAGSSSGSSFSLQGSPFSGIELHRLLGLLLLNNPTDTGSGEGLSGWIHPSMVGYDEGGTPQLQSSGWAESLFCVRESPGPHGIHVGGQPSSNLTVTGGSDESPFSAMFRGSSHANSDLSMAASRTSLPSMASLENLTADHHHSPSSAQLESSVDPSSIPTMLFDSHFASPENSRVAFPFLAPQLALKLLQHRAQPGQTTCLLDDVLSSSTVAASLLKTYGPNDTANRFWSGGVTCALYLLAPWASLQVSGGTSSLSPLLNEFLGAVKEWTHPLFQPSVLMDSSVASFYGWIFAFGEACRGVGSEALQENTSPKVAELAAFLLETVIPAIDSQLQESPIVAALLSGTAGGFGANNKAATKKIKAYCQHQTQATVRLIGLLLHKCPSKRQQTVHSYLDVECEGRPEQGAHANEDQVRPQVGKLFLFSSTDQKEMAPPVSRNEDMEPTTTFDASVQHWKEMVEKAAALDSGSIRTWETKPSALFWRLTMTLASEVGGQEGASIEVVGNDARSFFDSYVVPASAQPQTGASPRRRELTVNGDLLKQMLVAARKHFEQASPSGVNAGATQLYGSTLSNVYGDGRKCNGRKQQKRGSVSGAGTVPKSMGAPPKSLAMVKANAHCVLTAVLGDTGHDGTCNDIAELRSLLLDHTPDSNADAEMSLFRYLRAHFGPDCKDPKTNKKVGVRAFPATLRGEIWGALLRVNDPKRRHEAVASLHREHTSTISDRQIALDIPRCHQYNALLASTLGHRKLYRLLRMWLLKNPGYTYWQGLDSVCAGLLSVSFQDEPLVLATLEKVVDRYVPHYYAALSMDTRILTYSHLLRFHDPEVANHLDEEGCKPELYCVSWFLTLFAHVLPLYKCYPVWDSLFLSGEPQFATCFAVAITMLNRRTILHTDFGGCTTALGQLHSLDIQAALTSAWQILESTPDSVLKPDLETPKTASLVRNSVIPLLSVTELQRHMLPRHRGRRQQSAQSRTWLKDGVLLVDLRAQEELEEWAEEVAAAVPTPFQAGESFGNSSQVGAAHNKPLGPLNTSFSRNSVANNTSFGHSSFGQSSAGNQSLNRKPTYEMPWVKDSVWIPFELEGWQEGVVLHRLRESTLSIPPQTAPTGGTTSESQAPDPVLVLIAGKDPESAHAAADQLLEWGKRRVCILLGGMEEAIRARAEEHFGTEGVSANSSAAGSMKGSFATNAARVNSMVVRLPYTPAVEEEDEEDQ